MRLEKKVSSNFIFYLNPDKFTISTPDFHINYKHLSATLERLKKTEFYLDKRYEKHIKKTINTFKTITRPVSDSYTEWGANILMETDSNYKSYSIVLELIKDAENLNYLTKILEDYISFKYDVLKLRALYLDYYAYTLDDYPLIIGESVYFIDDIVKSGIVYEYKKDNVVIKDKQGALKEINFCRCFKEMENLIENE